MNVIQFFVFHPIGDHIFIAVIVILLFLIGVYKVCYEFTCECCFFTVIMELILLCFTLEFKLNRY